MAHNPNVRAGYLIQGGLSLVVCTSMNRGIGTPSLAGNADLFRKASDRAAHIGSPAHVGAGESRRPRRTAMAGDRVGSTSPCRTADTCCPTVRPEAVSRGAISASERPTTRERRPSSGRAGKPGVDLFEPGVHPLGGPPSAAAAPSGRPRLPAAAGSAGRTHGHQRDGDRSSFHSRCWSVPGEIAKSAPSHGDLRAATGHPC